MGKYIKCGLVFLIALELVLQLFIYATVGAFRNSFIEIAHAAAPVPTYRSSGTFTAGIGAITPPYPADMQAGDVCLLVASSENQSITLSSAQGFSEVTWSPQSAGIAATNPGSRLAVFWKRTVGGDSDPTIADSGNNTEGRIHCFYGVTDAGDPWDTGAGGNDGGANDTSGVVPGSTTTVDNTLVVLIISSSYNGNSTAQCSSWVNSSLANVIEISDNTDTSGLGGGYCMATGELATAGSYQNTTVAMAQTTYKGAISMALKPPGLSYVTTNSVSNVVDITATGNGDLTSTGGENADKEGFVYDTSSHGAPGNVDPVSSGYASYVENTGSYGTGAFTRNITGLTSGITYYLRAYAHNSAGYSYGSEVSFTTASIAISVSDGSVSYGLVGANTSKDTTSSGLNDTQIATNNGTVAEDFNIKGQDTSCPWILSSTTGSNQYIHEFSTNSGSSWTPLATSYQSLASNIATTGNQNFDLRITTPSSTNCYSQQSVDVTVQAVVH